MEIKLNFQPPFGVDKPSDFTRILKEGGSPKEKLLYFLSIYKKIQINFNLCLKVIEEFKLGIQPHICFRVSVKAILKNKKKNFPVRNGEDILGLIIYL